MTVDQIIEELEKLSSQERHYLRDWLEVDEICEAQELPTAAARLFLIRPPENVRWNNGCSQWPTCSGSLIALACSEERFNQWRTEALKRAEEVGKSEALQYGPERDPSR